MTEEMEGLWLESYPSIAKKGSNLCPHQRTKGKLNSVGNMSYVCSAKGLVDIMMENWETFNFTLAQKHKARMSDKTKQEGDMRCPFSTIWYTI